MSDPIVLAGRPKRPLWWRILRTMLVIAALLLAIPVVCIGGFRLLHDFENMPLCGKQTFNDIQNWYVNTRSKELPNVNGLSAESMAKLISYDANEAKEWSEKYQFVPGLRKGDPGDFVMMYMKVPTRWVHHAAGPPSIFNKYRWVLVPLDFAESGNPNGTRVDREIPYGGESFERVSSDELRSRLRKTLKFLQDNVRPHWQTVVAENEEFLKSL
jgi:hypothetical protein